MGTEVNGISERHIIYALCQATEFIGKTFHPDVAVLVHLDEMTKLEQFPGFIVNGRSGKSLVREIGMHCRLQLPQLKQWFAAA